MKLVDSSAWIEFLRRKGDPAAKQVVARLLQAGHAAFTCPIRFELLSGVRPEEEADLEQAFAFSQHILFQPEDWTAAALLERELRKASLSIPRNDLFVITAAIRANLPVVCRDTHFTMARKTLGSRLNVEQI